MDSAVQYRGYDILCSERGYTILRNDVEVWSEAVDDAGNGCRLEIGLERARRTIDQLIDGGSGRR